MSDFITILLTTYNRSRSLSNALFSIFNEGIKVPFEVLIIDDWSADNTKNIVRKWQSRYPNIRYIRAYKLTGFRNPGIPHNIGLVYAKGNIIVQSGADIIHPRGTVNKLYDEFKKQNCFLSAIVYSLGEDIAKKLDHENPDRFYKIVESNKKPYGIHFSNSDYANATPFCAIYKKEWAYKIGLYDEEFYMGGGEDCDFVYRMQRLVKTRWCKGVYVVHQDHPKFSGFTRNDQEYEFNLRRLENTKKGKENRWRKRILFLGSFNAYADPGFLWDSLRQHFMRLGHECVFFDACKKVLNDEEKKTELHKLGKWWSSDGTYNDILSIIRKFDPEIIFGSSGGTGITEILKPYLHTRMYSTFCF